MTLCSVYMAMLLTNWGDSEDAEPTRRYNLGVASAWVQVKMEGDMGEIWARYMGRYRGERLGVP